MAYVRGLIGDVEPAGKQCVEGLALPDAAPGGRRRTRDVVAIHKDDFTEVVREDPGGKEPSHTVAQHDGTLRDLSWLTILGSQRTRGCDVRVCRVSRSDLRSSAQF